jgi:alcohol dehydrogenase (cytochrome c)
MLGTGAAKLLIAPAARARIGMCLLAATMPVLTSAAQDANTGWPSYNRDFGSTRFVPLAQITARNVKDLRELCEVDLGDPGAVQPGPVVIDGTLLVTTKHTLVAVDAADCTVRWRHVDEAEEDEIWPVNRGVAYLDGKIFRGTGDGRLIAVDMATGREIWRAKIADPKIGEFLSGAPVAWSGLVFTGPSGGDWGIQGRIAAYDAATGKQVWCFHAIPLPGEPGYETWHVPETAKHGGGGTWSTFTLDPVTGELFAPIANPAPAFRADYRPGENLYTDSMVVLDARTGALKWYYQLEGNEGFDYDLGAAPMLYTDKQGHKRVALGSKDGYLYILDRDTHRLVSKTAVTTIKQPSGPPSPEGVFGCPGTDGGVEWNGPAYDPNTNLVYVGTVDWCWYFYSGEPKYLPTLSYMGAGNTFKPDSKRSGWVYALDGGDGKVAWSYHAGSPVLSGVTPTAGGVVFSGESSGNVLALDARSGALLHSLSMRGSLGGGVVTYAVGGTQYVATTAGNISRAGLSSAGDARPRLIIMSLGSKISPRQVVAYPAAEANRVSFGTDQGKVTFNVFCASCHGVEGKGGGSAPALIDESKRKSIEAIAQWIRDPAPPMPKLAPPLMESEVEAVARYVGQLSGTSIR